MEHVIAISMNYPILYCLEDKKSEEIEKYFKSLLVGSSACRLSRLMRLFFFAAVISDF